MTWAVRFQCLDCGCDVPHAKNKKKPLCRSCSARRNLRIARNPFRVRVGLVDLFGGSE